jgi:dipeptidyl aminopeptidase/acylaminoacyl peptidase
LDTARIGTQDYFVSKFNNIGQPQFTKQFGAATKNTDGNSLAIDTTGNIYVAGTTNGNLGTNTLAGIRDLYFSKHDVNGARLYTTQLGVGGGAATEGNGIAIDSAGNVYLVGNTSGNLGGVTRTGTFDLFLTKFNSTTGALLDTKLAGSAANLSNAIAITVDSSRNVYVTGWTQGAIGTNTQTGTRDVVLLKYDNTGARQYVKQLGTAGAGSEGYYLALDGGGNIYVAGKTDAGLAGNALTGTSDYFLSKFQVSDGTALYTRQLGATASETIGRAVAVDTTANAYVAGYTQGNLDGNTLVGSRDYFVAKYNSTGVKQ